MTILQRVLFWGALLAIFYVLFKGGPGAQFVVGGNSGYVIVGWKIWIGAVTVLVGRGPLTHLLTKRSNDENSQLLSRWWSLLCVMAMLAVIALIYETSTPAFNYIPNTSNSTSGLRNAKNACAALHVSLLQAQSNPKGSYQALQLAVAASHDAAGSDYDNYSEFATDFDRMSQDALTNTADSLNETNFYVGRIDTQCSEMGLHITSSTYTP